MRVVQHGMTFDINPQAYAADRTFNVLSVVAEPESLEAFIDTIETLTGHSIERVDGGALAQREDVAQWLAFEVREYL